MNTTGNHIMKYSTVEKKSVKWTAAHAIDDIFHRWFIIPSVALVELAFAIDSTSHSLGPPSRPPHNHRSFVLRNLQTLDSTSIYSPHCMTPEHCRGKERSFHIFIENRSSSQFTITSLITMNKFSHFILCLPSCARSSPIHSGIFRSSWVIRFYPIFAIALVSGCCAAVLHFPSRWFCVVFFSFA